MLALEGLAEGVTQLFRPTVGSGLRGRSGGAVAVRGDGRPPRRGIRSWTSSSNLTGRRGPLAFRGDKPTSTTSAQHRTVDGQADIDQAPVFLAGVRLGRPSIHRSALPSSSRRSRSGQGGRGSQHAFRRRTGGQAAARRAGSPPSFRAPRRSRTSAMALDRLVVLARPGTSSGAIVGLELARLRSTGRRRHGAQGRAGGVRLGAELIAFGCGVRGDARRHHRIRQHRASPPTSCRNSLTPSRRALRISLVLGLWTQP